MVVIRQKIENYIVQHGLLLMKRCFVAEINLTGIADLLTQVVGLMPSFVDLIVAVLPVMLVLIIVGFLAGLFDGIIHMVKGVLK